MNSIPKTKRVLGAAFLLQFLTSFSSGVFLRQAWLAPGNIQATMIQIASNPGLLRANILVDMLTALGIVFLGAVLYTTLRKLHQTVALTALGFYIVEAALLAGSRIATFTLLQISQEYVAGGTSPSLHLLGNLALESMDFVGSTLHMLAFSLGAILFYFLLYKSGIVPRSLSLWGLIAVIPCLLGTIATVFGYEAPFLLYLPYAPFELVIGAWILVKGIPYGNQTTAAVGLQQASA